MITVIKNEIRGTVLGREIIISEVTLSTTTRCESEGVHYAPNWKLDYEGDVSRSLLVNQSHQGKFTASKMTNKSRIIHQILNTIFLHKLGSKDSVSATHEFLLINILTERKVNLPAALFENFKKYTRKIEKLTATPYGALLQRILNT